MSQTTTPPRATPPDRAAASNEPDKADMSDEQRALTADIEATRERLGDTVEELAHRLDVKTQVEAKVDETKQAVQAKVDHARHSVDHARHSVQQTFAGATAALGPRAQHWKAAAAQAARQREVQIAAGVAIVAGVLGGALVRRGG